MNQFVIGIDIGATSIKFASVSLEGSLLNETTELTQGEKGKAVIVQSLLKGIQALLQKQEFGSLIGIGVGVPGVVDYKGIIKTLTNVPDWCDVNLASILQLEIQSLLNIYTRVIVENDANVAALGEAQFGAGKSFNDFVMITLGTGVGGGVIFNKKIFRGSTGGAGELGHITIDFKSDIIHAGIKGSIEGLIGHRQITAYTKSLLRESPSEILLNLCQNDLSNLEPKILTEAAIKGDSVAISVWKYVGEILGVGIGTIISILDIRKFIIGGGVAGAGNFVLEPTIQQAHLYSLPAMHEGIEIVPAQLGNKAGVMGAAALCLS